METQILIVEDSFTQALELQACLERNDYVVEAAHDGSKGWAWLKKNIPDIIISDINMPRMDGLGFVRNLRRDSKYKKTPVIVVSADRDLEVKKEFLSKGATSFIVKSDFDRGNLVQEVKNLIG